MKIRSNAGWMALAALLMALLIPVTALAMPEPSAWFYCTDEADVLSAEHENYYINQSALLADATGAQIVVATVSSLEGQDIESYANALFRQWGIGSSSANNGLLILLAPNEREIRVEVGYGLEGAINDAKAGRFIDDYAYTDLARNDFDAGIYRLYNALLAEVYAEYGLETPESAEAPRRRVTSSSHFSLREFLSDSYVIPILFLVLLIATRGRILLFLGGGGGSRRGGPRGGGFSGRGGGGFSGRGGSSGGGGASRRF